MQRLPVEIQCHILQYIEVIDIWQFSCSHSAAFQTLNSKALNDFWFSVCKLNDISIAEVEAITHDKCDSLRRKIIMFHMPNFKIMQRVANGMSEQFKSNANSQQDLLLKCLLIGGGCTGKTALMLRYTEDVFPTSHLPTLGVDLVCFLF